MADPNVLGAATIGLTQGLSSAQTFLPKLTEVRRSDPTNNPSMVGDVRMGEVATAVVTIGVGAIVSSLTGSSIPTVVSALIVLGIVLLYEAALRGDRLFEPRKADGNG